MKKHPFLYLFTVLSLCCSSLWAQTQIDAFTLPDQHNINHLIQFPSEKARILIIADKASGDQARRWGYSLGGKLGDSVDYIPIAAMGGVPDFLKGIAKSFIHEPRPILVDWDNIVSKKLGFVDNQCLILFIDPQGQCLVRSSGEVTPEKLNNVILQSKRYI